MSANYLFWESGGTVDTEDSVLGLSSEKSLSSSAVKFGERSAGDAGANPELRLEAFLLLVKCRDLMAAT
jgi:hypothetical protein